MQQFLAAEPSETARGSADPNFAAECGQEFPCAGGERRMTFAESRHRIVRESADVAVGTAEPHRAIRSDRERAQG